MIDEYLVGSGRIGMPLADPRASDALKAALGVPIVAGTGGNCDGNAGNGANLGFRVMTRDFSEAFSGSGP